MNKKLILSSLSLVSGLLFANSSPFAPIATKEIWDNINKRKAIELGIIYQTEKTNQISIEDVINIDRFAQQIYIESYGLVSTAIPRNAVLSNEDYFEKYVHDIVHFHITNTYDGKMVVLLQAAGNIVLQRLRIAQDVKSEMRREMLKNFEFYVKNKQADNILSLLPLECQKSGCETPCSQTEENVTPEVAKSETQQELSIPEVSSPLKEIAEDIE